MLICTPLYFEKRITLFQGLYRERGQCAETLCAHPRLKYCIAGPGNTRRKAPAQEVTWDSLLKYLESNALFFTFLLMWRQRKRI